MSGPVAKSLRGKKKKKDGGNLPAGNERKIEQVGKLSLPRVARPSSSVIEHAAVRFAKMSLRLQTNDRLDPCGSNAFPGGPFIRRGRVAKSILAGKQQDRSIARRN